MTSIQTKLKGDPVIWTVAMLLAIISIVTVYSAAGVYALKKYGGNTEAPLLKQLAYIGLSLGMMYLAHKIDYRYYAKIALICLVISVPLLLMTKFFGANINSASRWLRIPFVGITFQPSDLAKFALISYLSSILAKKQQIITDIKTIDEIKETFLPMLSWIGVICGLILWSNASNGLVLFATCMLLMIIGRVPFKYLLILCLIGMMAGGVALFNGQRAKTFMSRIEKFTSGKVSDIPYQLEHSYIAIASGGIAGKGAGKSTERNFLPHPYSDFIYAIIIEEYGLIGGAVVMFLFLVLLYRGMVTVARSERAFGGLLSAGLSFALFMQAFVNMGVAVGLGPVTGLPLPLVSMGGTSLLFTGISLGIILSVSKGEVEEEN
jgi:cell division protein FtsW